MTVADGAASAVGWARADVAVAAVIRRQTAIKRDAVFATAPR
jgi:hypothetical protein